METVNMVLAVVGVLLLVVVAFWAGRGVERMNSPLAKQARLTAVALAASKELKELRNPTKTPDTAAAAAKEVAAIAELQAVVSSVT